MEGSVLNNTSALFSIGITPASFLSFMLMHFPGWLPWGLKLLFCNKDFVFHSRKNPARVSTKQNTGQESSYSALIEHAEKTRLDEDHLQRM